MRYIDLIKEVTEPWEKEAPKYKQLENLGLNIVHTFEIPEGKAGGSITIQVYERGIVKYSEQGYNPVTFCLHTAKLIYYKGTKIRILSKEEYENEDAIAILYLIGSERVNDNSQKRHNYRVHHRLNEDATNVPDSTASKDFSYTVIEEMMLSEISDNSFKETWESLTEKQKELVLLRYNSDMNLREAAEKLNISRETARDRLEGVKKKFIKFL